VYAQQERLGVRVAPIPGTKRVKWLEQNVAALDVTLTPDELALLDLHWDPGLGRQLTVLLAVIGALHLNPAPLTWASFAGIAPQRHGLNGD